MKKFRKPSITGYTHKELKEQGLSDMRDGIKLDEWQITKSGSGVQYLSTAIVEDIRDNLLKMTDEFFKKREKEDK